MAYLQKRISKIIKRHIDLLSWINVTILQLHQNEKQNRKGESNRRENDTPILQT